MAQQAPSLTGDALVKALREGGYTIYFRHAETSWSQADHVTAAGDWKTCDASRMRQLSEEGRRTARKLGKMIRALGLPVGRVLASEYCRAVETAQLMRLGPVDTTADIINTRVAEFYGGLAGLAERARGRLAMRPETGTNTILVAHGNVLRAATGISLGEAGAAIFAPRPDGTVALVARLSPEDWAALAK
jgi:broad specificity phosphatase PhoE